MREYIDREQDKYIKLSQALEVLDSCACWWAHERMERIPTADVRPVVKSKWADNRISFYRGCPECGAFVRTNLDEVFLRDFQSAVGKLNFCPNCGADMRETNDEVHREKQRRHGIGGKLMDCYKCPYKPLCHDLPINMSCEDVLNYARWRKADV